MKRRYLAVMGLLVIMAMVLSACGGGAATPEPAAPAAPEAEEAAPAEAAPTEAPAEEAAPAAAEGVVTINFLGDSPGSGSDFRDAHCRVERCESGHSDQAGRRSSVGY